MRMCVSRCEARRGGAGRRRSGRGRGAFGGRVWDELREGAHQRIGAMQRRQPATGAALRDTAMRDSGDRWGEGGKGEGKGCALPKGLLAGISPQRLQRVVAAAAAAAASPWAGTTRAQGKSVRRSPCMTRWVLSQQPPTLGASTLTLHASRSTCACPRVSQPRPSGLLSSSSSKPARSEQDCA